MENVQDTTVFLLSIHSISELYKKNISLEK